MPSLTDLSKEFQPKAEQLIKACATRGVTMRPYFTLRDPLTQAKLWRQSRSTEEIQERIKFLSVNGAPYLADCLAKAGPQHGPKVTDALPGESWHQWGEAIDCFWLLDGKANWSVTDGGSENGYLIYADTAKEMQLTAGGHWNRLKDWPHVQRQAQKVTDQYSWAEIDTEMRNRYDRVI